MDNKIKSVTSINQQGTKVLAIGKDNVVLIKDFSKEYESSIHIQFNAYDNKDKLIGMFINGALYIEYYT